MGNGIFSDSKPIAGALLACVPLAATGATSVSAWENTDLLGTGSDLKELGDLEKGFNEKGVLENMDGNFSGDSLKDILGVEMEPKAGDDIDIKKLEAMAGEFMERASKNNTLGDISDFETSDDKVVLSATQSDSEKSELADSFLEAKKLGIYDIDWTVDPMSGTYSGATAYKPEKERLADVFGSMGGVSRNFAMAKFLTIKDKASNEVLGQVTLTSDPLGKGNVRLGAWAKDGNKLVNALNLVFKALSKNENINKVLVTLSGGSGKKIEGVLKKVSEGKGERFKKLTIVESVNFMEITKTKDDGRYIFRTGTLKKINGKNSEPENLQEKEIPESEVDSVKGSISFMWRLSSSLSPTDSTGKSVVNPDTEEVIDSFVLKSTDYEFSE